MSAPSFSAPGKVFLLGDYSVLRTGRAMVMAIDRRAVGTIKAGLATASPLIQAVIDQAGSVTFDRQKERIEVDTSRFFAPGVVPGEKKLGLGSSSACAVVAAALALGKGDEDTLSLALKSHRRANGDGSGVDIAASFYGGILAAARQPGPVTPLASRLFGLHIVVLFTGQSASTADLIDRVLRAPHFDSIANELADLAEQGIRAWSYAQADRFLSVIALAGRRLEALSREAETPIVTEPIAALMRLAGEHGAAAKPSGAGGGDVAILVTRDLGLGDRLAEQTGMTRLELSVSRTGLQKR